MKIPSSDAEKGKRKRGTSVETHAPALKKFLDGSAKKTVGVEETEAAGGSSKPAPVLSLNDQWRSLFRDFEDLTLEHAASPWDSRLNCRQFVAEKVSLDLQTPVVRRLGMGEICEAIANYGLKVATLSTSLAQVYKAHDAGREQLESVVSHLKLLLEKSRTDLAAEKRAKTIVDENQDKFEKQVSKLQNDLEASQTALE